MRSTFKVLFYLKKNATKKNGFVPVMCRITINGTIAQFSCKYDIFANLWDVKSNRASGNFLQTRGTYHRGCSTGFSTMAY
ncbi:MAG: Arm DNA-binding domain-containing protein, partial [Prevotella sp.]|nr:Arm DNA-binding domain-containing protein [Prevotella sp.]